MRRGISDYTFGIYFNTQKLKFVLMKRMIFTILALTSIVSIINAQDNSTDSRDKLMFGLKAGVNLSNVYDTKGEDLVADSKFGFAGGAFLSVPFGKIFGIQPEILFSQKGFKGKFLGAEYTQTSSYIDMPLLLALKPNAFATLLFGPQFSFLAKEKDTFVNLSETTEFDNLRKNTFCLTGGADINVMNFVLSARAGWDVQKNNGDGYTTPRYKNVWYQATLGLRF
jgi:hypothetical protein